MPPTESTATTFPDRPLHDSRQSPSLGPPRPISISHLMLWTLGSAVVMTWLGLVTDWGAIANEYHTFFRLTHVASSFTYGAALTAVGLLAWRQRGISELRDGQPGHHLLVLAAAAVVIELTVAGGVRIWAATAPVSMHDNTLLQQGLIHVSATALLAACLIRSRFDWPWILIPLTLLIMSLSQSTWHALTRIIPTRHLSASWWQMPNHIQVSFLVATILVVILAVIHDRRRHHERDWLHWAGVAVAICLCTVNALVHIGYGCMATG